MSLLDRIQQTVDRPLAGFTRLELDRISFDWQRFDKLLANLECEGHL